MQYVVSITPDEYLLATHFNAIETTRDEQKAIKVEKKDTNATLAALRRMGYEPLLIRITETKYEMAAEKRSGSSAM